MWHGFAVCLSLLGADDVIVKPLHGDAVRGSLTTLNEKLLVIQSAAGEVKWDAGAVQSVKPVPAGNLPVPAGNLPAPAGNLPAPAGNLPAPAGNLPAPEEKPAPRVTVELTDNTTVVGNRVTLATGQAELDFPSGESFEIPSRLIRGVRFRRQDDELQKQWNALAATVASGDQLIVRKASAPDATAGPSTIVLDQLEGVVHAVSPTGVAFEFDGERINVPLEKVEGILLHHRQSDAWPDPICRVRDSRGGVWNVQTLQFANGKLSLQTVAGVRGELTWEHVVEIDYSTGNLVFLSDLKPESVEWRPYLVTPATPPALGRWFRMRGDQNTDGSVLTLAGQSYEKGLSVHSRSLLSYRLTKDYRHFQAVAGIDERFRGPASLKLIITGDERTLLARDVRGNDPPFEFDLDIRGVRRLKILVDFGEDRSDAGDHLLLCNARLTK